MSTTTPPTKRLITEQEIDLTTILHGETEIPPIPPDADFVKATLVLDCKNELGECILFDNITHSVMWTDIYKKTFHQVILNYPEPTKVIYRTYTLPKQLCSFGLLETTTTTSIDSTSSSTQPTSAYSLPMLCAWEDGFQLYDIAQQKPMSEYSEGEDVNPKKQPTRLNDGRVDPTGRYYICGGYYGDVPGNKMKVYKVQQQQDAAGPRLMHEPIVSDIEVTNSICWSPDGNTMYLADSPTKQIHSYTYKDGTISNKKLVLTKDDVTSGDGGVPDGSCVDAEGYIWNAVWKAGIAPSCVQRIDPNTGQVVYVVHMPDGTSQVTCCCFGGRDLDILFITTAAVDIRSDANNIEPHAGGLYAAKVPFRGRPENRFTVHK